ncbi:hypothetical protein SAMN05660706_11347 [Desulfoscipio geothermicus DSM 3669]|uniref:Uncharacterized protein n=1 Tax=Desulfoscipio geothermicus DSM 3669 TaxID=1121426 RepID=A0A1I6DLV3_9FIRM|nr:hypothetical protein SAMN05660706_11347 [Desulfoscipio geothermicus DSM 3669]
MARRTARPMVALARLPGPKRFCPEFMPNSPATGPLTTQQDGYARRGGGWAVRPKAGSQMACMAVTHLETSSSIIINPFLIS